MNERPNCPTCKRQCARTTTTAGQGKFQCTNPQCREYLKTYFERPK